MASIEKPTIASFNQFISDQKKEHGREKVKFTLVTFNNQTETMIPTRDVHDVPDLTHETFKPQGNTALYDAMAETIDNLGKELSLMKESDRPKSVVFVVLTDGEENASRKVSKDDVFNRVTHQQTKYSWEFIYLGANQDAIKEAGKMGIVPECSLSYGYCDRGVTEAISVCSKAVADTTKGVKKCAFTSADRDRCR